MSDGGDDGSGSDLEIDVPRDPQADSRFTSAGNEADVEDNDLFASAPKPELIIKKLKRSAAVGPGGVDLCCPATPCKVRDAMIDGRKSANSTMHSPDRLNTRPKSAMEMITDTIEKPKGAVPPLALPDWHCLSMDKIIPLLPAPQGIMYYTPGKICRKLHREPRPKDPFNIKDPYNRERIVRYPYSAIRDPHAKSFIMGNHLTKKLLIQQGLINPSGDVMVPLNDFNKFRDYLRTLYTDEVNERFREADELFRKDREQLRSIHQHKVAVEDRAAYLKKLAAHRRVVKLSEYYRSNRTRQKLDQTNVRLQLWSREREKEYAEKIVVNAQKGKLQREKQRQVFRQRQIAGLKMLQRSVLKQMKAQEVKELSAELFKKANEAYLMEWMDTKISQSQARLAKENEIKRSWLESIRSRARSRQRKVEYLQKEMPILVVRRRKEAARLLELSRKYFYIWLNNVRKRKAATEDDNHSSAFLKGAAYTLDKTVTYLRFQTGINDKLDTFIVNILRLKSAIRKQLELEGSEGDSNALLNDDDDEEEMMPPEPSSPSSAPKKQRSLLEEESKAIMNLGAIA